MYPNLYYFFKDSFGVEIGVLRFINSFGFFVAISFLVAAALLAHELRRKSKQGLFQPTEMKVVVGKPATTAELITNFILGFIFGFKIIALFFLSSDATRDPQEYIFSSMGNPIAGLLTGLVFAGVKWWDKKKNGLPQPEERTVRLWPQDRVGELTIIALVVGLVGAKVFDVFENWDSFLKDPSSIFSGGGLTFYGGLICATFAIIIYARRHKIGVTHLADAIAPALMIAYAVGRIGCQVAGDGDWGIYNSAYKVDSAQHIVVAQKDDFPTAIIANSRYFQENPNLEHASSPAPKILSFLPNWFFAYDYPHNVNSVGVPIPDCKEQRFCSHLPVPVFPTPMYETIACTILFLILWGLRDRLKPAGALFCLYLILNGFERSFIEKIRVNNRMHFLGLHPTQAEVISTGLVITGVILWILLRQKNRTRVS